MYIPAISARLGEFYSCLSMYYNKEGLYFDFDSTIV